MKFEPRQRDLKATESAQAAYDRDIFLLIIAIALALSFNVQGLIAWIERHVPLIVSLRLSAYAVALTSGGLVGLFSRRIASRITAWRDQDELPTTLTPVKSVADLSMPTTP